MHKFLQQFPIRETATPLTQGQGDDWYTIFKFCCLQVELKYLFLCSWFRVKSECSVSSCGLWLYLGQANDQLTPLSLEPFILDRQGFTFLNMAQPLSLFCFFSSFSRYDDKLSTQSETKLKKHRCCAWDLNPGPQDERMVGSRKRLYDR